MKRTYLEIIKTLECCNSNRDCTKNCPYAEYKIPHFACIDLSTADAVALIRNQHSQIEKLKTKLNYFYGEEHIEQMQQEKKAIEYNAIKEFVEKLKAKSSICVASNNGQEIYSTKMYIIMAYTLDDIVAGMVGADNG